MINNQNQDQIQEESLCVDNGIDINIKELLYESDYKQSYINSQYLNFDVNYNSFDNDNINGMTTYNALRYLYRDTYDIRSKGYVNIMIDPNKVEGLENHPVTGQPMKINYFNDFSISSKFNQRESNNFNDNLCDMLSMSLFSFVNENGPYKNIINERTIDFLRKDNNKKENKPYTTDFFSFNMQVNPLLYTYRFIDKDNKVIIMNPDTFLKYKIYDKFNNLSYIMKGNQSSVALWQYIMNIKFKKDIIEDDEGNIIDNEIVFDNNDLLFKDDYTKEFMYILQNPKKYFKFIKQNDYIDNERSLIEQDIQKKTIKDIVNEEDSRGYLFFDVLLDIVLKRVDEAVNIDNEINDEIKKNSNILRELVKKPLIRNTCEFDGFPVDQYLTNDKYFLYDTGTEKCIKMLKEKLGAKVLGTYKYQYNVVYGQYFRLLPYILSGAYKYKIQSPSMNIMYMAFTIMAIKNAYYHNNDQYNKVFDRLYESVKNIDNFDLNDVKNEFYRIFDNDDFLSNNINDHLMNILPILTQNTSAINFNGNNEDDLDELYSKLHYHVETNLSKMEFIEENVNDDTNKKKIMIDRALILLTEFFYKADKIRYFDASTFCIDYTLINEETRKSLKLFADALMEASYIHMNILGTEAFFNGEVPGHDYIGNIYNIAKNLFDSDFIEFDTTRVAKQNNKLYEESLKVNNNYKNNSFNSYLSVINIYISLVYCINITLDNLKSNIYNIGPYKHNNIRRSQSPWTIFKRYTLHMTYINNNSYGIYNDTPISNNIDKDTVQKIRVSQRIKWLTYGLHLRVWFNDAYFFFTNYKKVMIDYNGDVQKSVKYINQLYNEHVENITEPLPLFKNIEKNMIIPMPNIGLATAPMMGSYGINVSFICMFKYLRNNNNVREHILSLVHHGLKDIMVGDSMSSIIGERYVATNGLLSNENLSYNNINGNLQKLYNDIGMSYFYEVVIAYNLNYLYKKYIVKYFLENPKSCLLLNSTSDTSYDEKFFKNQKIINEFNYAYDCTWCSDIFNNIIFNKNVNKYMRFINKVITLHRIYIDNFYTYNNNFNNKNTESDSLIFQFYDKYYSLSLMNTQFINKYKKGIKKLIKKKFNYVIFNKIVKRLFSGNSYNDNFKIANTITLNNCLFGFEDLLIRNTYGGTMLAMYESPYMLLLYNNLDFDCGIIPSQQQLYTFTRNLYIYIYSIMKRLIVELDKDKDPFKDYKNSTEYIDECINDAYIISDKNFNDNEIERFNDIKSKGSLYKFATSICQFMDYDFLSSQYSQLLNNEYSLNNEADIARFINNLRNNRSEDIVRYESYCENIDTIENYLNNIINNVENDEEIATIKNIDKIRLTTNHARQVEYSEYPNKVNSKSDIIKFAEYANQKHQEHLEAAQKQLNEIENTIVDVTDNINNNNNQDNNNIGDSNMKMIVDAINQMASMLSTKLDKINENIYMVKEAVVNTNLVLKQIRNNEQLQKNNNITNNENNNNEEEIIVNYHQQYINNNEKEDITHILDLCTGTDTSLNINNGISINNDDNDPENERINSDVYIDNIIDDDISNDYNNNDDEIIDFYKGNNTEVLHVKKDLSVSKFEDMYYIDNENIDINTDNISEDILNSEYNMDNIGKANYDDYYFIDKKCLLKMIPYCGFVNKDDDNNHDDKFNVTASFVNIDLYKAKKQNIPIYSVDPLKLMIPINNIPIIFNQKLEYIINDIRERIGIYDKDIANKIIKFLNDNIIMFKDWDNNMQLRSRLDILKLFFIKMKKNKLLKLS